jgi:DNA-binding CsgD family transcriptional regulator
LAKPAHATHSVKRERDNLDLGRDACRQRAWNDAYRHLTLADEVKPLAGADIELLALAAGLSGHDEALLKAFERGHQFYLEAGDLLRAARFAFWMGFRLQGLGEVGRSTGWFARADRLVKQAGCDCVEAGYLLVPQVYAELAAGDCDAAFATAEKAAELGVRFGEADLTTFARNLQGRARLRQGSVSEGLRLLDEAMVAVTAGELSPVLTGLVYCHVLASCHSVYALDRAREWTAALADWCAAQPQLVAFSGRCLVHRAEIMQLNGAWKESLAEARRAAREESVKADPRATAAALYQEAEVHRLEGDFAAAEEAYRRASELGMEPQPGLALLRLTQGRVDAALATIRRVLDATTDRLQRARLLPAFVEIMLAAAAIEDARGAADELDALAATFATPVLGAMAAHARGAVALAEDDAAAAVVPLRASFALWQAVGAPYLAARLRLLIGLACRTLGDNDGAELEFAAARSVFGELGAKPDIARLDRLRLPAARAASMALTARELQVLRLIATGKTNKAIAEELGLSEKTVDRHVSNIFVKLDVPSRAAATAHAYERGLMA